MFHSPEWMDFTTEQHNPFAIDEYGLFIPCHLQEPVSIEIPTIQRINSTHIFLKQSPLHRIRMLGNCQSIQLVANGSAGSLDRQTGNGPSRRELHGPSAIHSQFTRRETKREAGRGISNPGASRHSYSRRRDRQAQPVGTSLTDIKNRDRSTMPCVIQSSTDRCCFP